MHGRRMKTTNKAKLIRGIILAVLGIILLLLIFILPEISDYSHQRQYRLFLKEQNINQIISHLMNIFAAEYEYKRQCGNFGTLQELCDKNWLYPHYLGGLCDGTYTLSYKTTPDGGFLILAKYLPKDGDAKDRFHFTIDHHGVIIKYRNDQAIETIRFDNASQIIDGSINEKPKIDQAR